MNFPLNIHYNIYQTNSSFIVAWSKGVKWMSECGHSMRYIVNETIAASCKVYFSKYMILCYASEWIECGVHTSTRCHSFEFIEKLFVYYIKSFLLNSYLFPVMDDFMWLSKWVEFNSSLLNVSFVLFYYYCYY